MREHKEASPLGWWKCPFLNIHIMVHTYAKKKSLVLFVLNICNLFYEGYTSIKKVNLIIQG